MGKTKMACEPLPYNASAATESMQRCAEYTVDVTEGILLATVALLFGAAVLCTWLSWCGVRR